MLPQDIRRQKSHLGGFQASYVWWSRLLPWEATGCAGLRTLQAPLLSVGCCTESPTRFISHRFLTLWPPATSVSLGGGHLACGDRRLVTINKFYLTTCVQTDKSREVSACSQSTELANKMHSNKEIKIKHQV